MSCSNFNYQIQVKFFGTGSLGVFRGVFQGQPILSFESFNKTQSDADQDFRKFMLKMKKQTKAENVKMEQG